LPFETYFQRFSIFSCILSDSPVIDLLRRGPCGTGVGIGLADDDCGSTEGVEMKARLAVNGLVTVAVDDDSADATLLTVAASPPGYRHDPSCSPSSSSSVRQRRTAAMPNGLVDPKKRGRGEKFRAQ
jgi:hypothetical protein